MGEKERSRFLALETAGEATETRARLRALRAEALALADVTGWQGPAFIGSPVVGLDKLVEACSLLIRTL